MKIYWAAPLHDEDDRERNNRYVERLRKDGHEVYVPQEHGIWEEVAKKMGSEDEARKYLFKLDMNAMQQCQACVACCGDRDKPRGPSEGMLWEMGYMAGCNKPVYLYNHGSYHRYNLMPQFGSTMVFEEFEELLKFLKEEAPV